MRLPEVFSFFLLISLSAHTSIAAAPMQKVSGPGFYRTMLGEFEITALSDGTVDLPVDKLLANITPENVKQALSKNFVSAPLETSDNGYLINTGAKLVLIDTGAGSLFGPTLGKLLGNLRASGYQPEQVDEIYITHMHPDHVGGLVSGGKMAFPNAVVRADKNDADYWLSQENLNKAPADAKGRFQGAMASLNPYIKAGRFKPFDSDAELISGVRSLATHGHTAGHNCYMIESDGKKLLVWGDLLHVAAVQFENPSVTMRFDSDSESAEAARKKILANAAQEKYWIAGAHLQFPGLGHVRSEGNGYVWVPANYTTVK